MALKDVILGKYKLVIPTSAYSVIFIDVEKYIFQIVYHNRDPTFNVLDRITFQVRFHL